MNKVRCRALAEIRASENDGDDFIIMGVASAANLDRKGTYIDQDALWEATKRYTTRTLFWMHDWNAPIGRVEELARGDNELHIRARIGHDFEIPIALGFSGTTWNVNNIRQLVKQKIVNGFSIGFDAEKRDAEEEGAPPTLLPTDLMEISVVTVPANEKTTFSFARSMIIDGAKESRTATSYTGLVKPQRFEFANLEQDLGEEQEYLKAALRQLHEAVADWK